MDRDLLALLACPLEHHAPVREDGDYLSCTVCGRRFPVRNGIPVLLVDEALHRGRWSTMASRDAKMSAT